MTTNIDRATDNTITTPPKTAPRGSAMARTTEQWEALLIPKLPEELWVEESDWDDEAWDVCFRHPNWDVPTSLGLAHRKDVAHLFAAAQEAVAEAVRLRRAITDLRDDYLAHITDYDEATITHMCYGTAADDLTRVLEGDHR